MATIPKIKVKTNSSVDILNAIRNSSITNYKDYVPVATDIESIKTIGRCLFDSPNLMNEFLNTLLNRIALVNVVNREYKNPLARMKKGFITEGETIEEVYVDIAKAHQYDTDVAVNEVFKKENPDVKTAFHILNFQKFYKRTINRNELSMAFNSLSGLSDFVSKLIETMYTTNEYHDYVMTKYVIARNILDGRFFPIDVSATQTKDKAEKIRATTNNFNFMSRKFNVAGVMTNTPDDNKLLLVDTNFDAKMDIDVLAYAFSMTKAEYLSKRILIDGFGEFDDDVLKELFEGDENFTPFTEEEKTALNSIPAILVDENFFQIYDVLQEVTDIQNPQGLYWNYWLHIWRVYSASPFANRAVFTPVTPRVISITPAFTEITVAKGSTLDLSATVKTEGFASEVINFSSNSNEITISSSGVVKIPATAKSGVVTITLTSDFDPSKTATVSVTVK